MFFKSKIKGKGSTKIVLLAFMCISMFAQTFCVGQSVEQDSFPVRYRPITNKSHLYVDTMKGNVWQFFRKDSAWYAPITIDEAAPQFERLYTIYGSPTQKHRTVFWLKPSTKTLYFNDKGTAWVPMGGGGGGGTVATNLSLTANATTNILNNTNGTGAIFNAANSIFAGLMLPAQVTKLAGIRDSGDATMSIVGSGRPTNPFRLFGDQTTPPNNSYFGTNASGTKGFFALPSGTQAANLSLGTPTASTLPLLNSNGTGVTLNAATSSTIGLMPSVDKTKSDFITVTSAVNLNALQNRVTFTDDGAPLNGTNNIDALDFGANLSASYDNTTKKITVTGASGGGGSVPSNLALGTLTTSTVPVTNSNGTGLVIPEVTTTTAGVMSVPLRTELKAHTTALGIAAEATNFGTFTGSTLQDNQTAKANFQQLETTVESKNGLIEYLDDNNPILTNGSVEITKVNLGTNLTGVIDASTGKVTINATASGGGGGLQLQKLTNGIYSAAVFAETATTLNVTQANGAATVTLSNANATLTRLQIVTSSSDWATGTKFTVTLPTMGISGLDYPNVQFINTSNGQSASPTSPHLYNNVGSAPRVRIVGNTATTVTIEADGLNTFGSTATILITN